MSAIAPISNFSFGDYAIPKGKTFEQMQTLAKVQKIFFVIMYSALVALSFILIPISLPIAVIGAVTFSYKTIQAILAAVGVFYRAKPQQLFPKEVEAVLPALGAVSDKSCSGFATQNGIESHEWKLNLIRAAKQSIFISGCYCGGKAFNETLDLICERMRLLPALKTSILSSDIFVTDENKKCIQGLEKEFGDRFTCIVTPEVFPYVSPTTDRFTLSTNHTKALIIDYGSAFLLGGSGILSPWTEQTAEFAAKQIESHGFTYDNFLKVYAYRDMDFVFQSPELNGIGTRLYVEMTKLFERFRYKESKAPFTPWPARIDPPLVLPRQINNLKIACYATGPEVPTTAFHDEIVTQVKKATQSIAIDHMYFHPSKELLQALIAASNLGIKITLLTNKLGSQSPGSHLTYAELSRYYAKDLFEGKAKPQIEHYEYNVPHATLHKKAIVIDRKTTLLGSSNIGKKSLEGADYEIDLKVKSEDFANSVLESIEKDKILCLKDQTHNISLKTRLYSSFQSLFVPFL